MTDLKFGAASETGRVRKANEDSMLHEPPLFAIADGMGGHAAGDVASRIAVETLAAHAGDGEALSAAVKAANSAIFDEAASHPEQTGMGTTLTALWAKPASVQIVHVGDSRAYLLRGDQLEKLTQDHTVVARLVAQGRISAEEADHHPQRSYLERTLGNAPDVEVDVNLVDIQPGDRILLCSDGLYGMIHEQQIVDLLLAEPDPSKASKRLCEAAIEAGGHDNVSVIVIDYPGEPSASAPKTAEASAAPQSPSRERSRRWVKPLVIAIVVLLTAVVAARFALANAWYVGEQGGRVAIFNGIRGNIAGFELSKVYAIPGPSVDELPAIWQDRVREGITADDEEDALEVVQRLQERAQENIVPPTSTVTGIGGSPAAESRG